MSIFKFKTNELKIGYLQSKLGFDHKYEKFIISRSDQGQQVQ